MDRYHHGDLPAALVAAGVAILERDGLDALTLRSAARSVGVSHAAPARHFADAASFLAAIAAAGYRRLAEDLAAAGGRDEVEVEVFRAVGHAYVRFALLHPHWYRAIFHPSLADSALYPELHEASAQAFGVLRTSVQRAIAAGALRDEDVATVALTAWATVHGIATLLIDGLVARKGYRQHDEDLAELVLRTMYLGLRP